MTAGLRHLVVVLGDQLDRHSAAFDGFDPSCDAVWMAEVAQESTRVPVSRQRIAIFLAAMRHFAEGLRQEAFTVHYRRLDEPATLGSLAAQITADIALLNPRRVVMVEPGEWGVRESLRDAVAGAGCVLDERMDRHFMCSGAEFAAHARGRRQLRMEHFYREMRKRHRVLMEGEEGDQPAGGAWNFDAENREAFGADGPGFVPPPARFSPDEITLEVIRVVNAGLPGAPGSLDDFGWPVTREQALQALEVFVEERLEHFGRWQDAMWSGQPWLYHAHLSAALNLKLLDPREVIARAEAAWRQGRVPLASAEGFIRQVLGWREYVRGIYWLKMPGYADMNALDAHEPLPAWYWNGATDMECLREAIGQTLRLGYAHHIQRLMVTGLYALLLGVEPRQVHEWYLSVYVDAVEWVELPNTLGMSQFADGGLMASKPYAATGKYIERMSDHCRHCRYRPERRTGSDACPFTTLYWDFLLRHEKRFANHPRMALQVKNVARIDEAERRAIGERASEIRRGEVGAA